MAILVQCLTCMESYTIAWYFYDFHVTIHFYGTFYDFTAFLYGGEPGIRNFVFLSSLDVCKGKYLTRDMLRRIPWDIFFSLFYQITARNIQKKLLPDMW